MQQDSSCRHADAATQTHVVMGCDTATELSPPAPGLPDRDHGATRSTHHNPATFADKDQDLSNLRGAQPGSGQQGDAEIEELLAQVEQVILPLALPHCSRALRVSCEC